jgi:SAM-dependent methyltransferase
MQLADPVNACVACGSAHIDHWRTKSYQYSGGVAGHPFQIDRCADCGSGFLNPPPAPEALAAVYATSGHGLRAPVASTDVLAAEACWPNSVLDARRMVAGAGRLLGPGAPRTALDVGSGFGFFTQALLAAGLDTTAINPGEYENAVFEDINGFRPAPVMLEDFQPTGPFGVVLMSQVLEHIVEPVAALRHVHSMLHSDGVLVCAVPNFGSLAVRLLSVRDNACLWVPEHVNYFTARGLAAVLDRAGFAGAGFEQVTRIRPDALVRRLPNALPERPLRALVIRGQRPVVQVLDRAGWGSFITVYGTPR